MKAAAVAIWALFFICEAQVYRTHTSENPVTIVLLGRNRDLRKTFHENGNVKTKCEYNKERRDGVCREYYENGILKSSVEFRNGREHGNANFYYETGVKRMRIEFKRGKPSHRETIVYDEDGKRTSNLNVREDGERHGN